MDTNKVHTGFCICLELFTLGSPILLSGTEVVGVGATDIHLPKGAMRFTSLTIAGQVV